MALWIYTINLCFLEIFFFLSDAYLFALEIYTIYLCFLEIFIYLFKSPEGFLIAVGIYTIYLRFPDIIYLLSPWGLSQCTWNLHSLLVFSWDIHLFIFILLCLPEAVFLSLRTYTIYLCFYDIFPIVIMILVTTLNNCKYAKEEGPISSGPYCSDCTEGKKSSDCGFGAGCSHISLRCSTPTPNRSWRKWQPHLKRNWRHSSTIAFSITR